MRYAQALAWINDLTNYEREVPQDSRAFRQPNAKAFLKYIGKTHQRLKIIHLAGSKGKGSTAAMTEALLRRSGYSTGLYTSPHLIDQRERIKIDGKPIGKQAFADQLQTLINADILQSPTYFEIMTFVGMLAFIEANVDFIVLETGLGGRLDTTNVFKPRLSIITRIGKDHCKILGNTLAQIATEKCGIIKTRVPVITCKQHVNTRDVIEGMSRERTAPLITTALATIKAPLYGQHQQQNFAMTLAAMALLEKEHLINASWHEHKHNFSVDWPGRFQVIQKSPPIVLDGAHNPEAVRQLIRTWQSYSNEKPVVLWGCTDDKDWQKGLLLMSVVAKRFIFCPLPSKRGVSPKTLMQYWKSQVSNVPCQSATSIENAREISGASAPLLITGSLYLVGEALKSKQGITKSYST